MEIKLKRAYEPAAPTDGLRVYVDHLWPRGMSHQTFHYDVWDKDIAPSKELREWFHVNRDANWTEFVQRYTAELRANPALEQLRRRIEGCPVVTLLYSSKNQDENNAVVLKHVLDNQN